MTSTSAPDPDQLVQNAVAALRRQGGRVTAPRRLVLEILAGTDEHLSADDLHERIGTRVDGVHLATVYRTVDALVQAGLIAHVHLPHGATTYHLVTDADRLHCHVVCTACDRVVDVPADLLDEVADTLLRHHGFRLDARHVALTGRCDSCLPD